MWWFEESLTLKMVENLLPAHMTLGLIAHLEMIGPHCLLTLPPDVFALSIPGFASSSKANPLKWKSIPMSHAMSADVR